MRKNTIYIVVIICMLVIVGILIKKCIVKDDNINYDSLEFEIVNISKSKFDRYNELINIPEISILIRSLPSVFNTSDLSISGVIKYSYMYAYTFKDDIEEYIQEEKNKKYINSKYLENIIYEIFNKDLDLDYYKEENGYILVNINDLITDTADLSINKISYNEEYNLYKIVIQEYENLIQIIYRKNNDKYAVLWCMTEKNGWEYNMKKIGYKIVSFTAILLEWINIILFLAAMGYEIEILEKIRQVDNISEIYYLFAGIDILLFSILTRYKRKQNKNKEMLVYIYCCLVQIALLIFKVKI